MKITDENIQFAAAQRLSGGSLVNRAIGVASGISFATVALFVVAAYGGNAAVETQRSQAPSQKISYGSRAGMNLTIVSKTGTDTSNAVIFAEMTEYDARSYCEQYVQDTSPGCVKNQLKDKSLSKTIVANCDTGDFRNFYGERLRYVRSNNGSSLIRRSTGEILDGSAASGLSYNTEQFAALCPSSMKVDVRPSETTTQRMMPAVGGREVQARGSGILPGAIICPDLQAVRLMQMQFARHWEETTQDRLTRGQSGLIRGKATAYPDFAAFGCALIPAGQILKIEVEKPIPIVSAQLPGGTVIRGVTFSTMYQGNSPSPF